MKKLSFMLILCVFALFSCSDDDKNNDSTNSVSIDKEDLKGNITGSVNLESGVTYKLTGALIVKKGASLTIPAGTVILATEASGDPGDVKYIAVEQGAKININGTASKPVVMTSEIKETESWGGLVICGYAPTNKGANPTSEVANLAYGGDVPDDNSGSITYLRVEYSGYKYSDDKEFNGISFFGVGSGTKVEYVSAYAAGDDGLEFFGGTVNAKYLVSIDAGDDGIDFADGWQGIGEKWYVRNAKKSAIEGSNNGDNGDAIPVTKATLSDLTLITMGEKPWYLKEGAGEQTITNVVIGGLADGKSHDYFYIDSDDSEAINRALSGKISVTDARFINIGSHSKSNQNLTITEQPNALGAGNVDKAPAWAAAWSVPSN